MFNPQSEVNWSDIKVFLDTRKVSAQYIDFKNTYWILGIDGPFQVWCRIPKDDPKSAEQVEFEDNYQAAANTKKTDTDDEGRDTIRLAYAKKGWVYLAHPIEFETAKLNSGISKDWTNTDRGDHSIKYYKLDNGTEVEMVQGADDDATFQTKLDTECIRTDILFKIGSDYELIGGNIHQKTRPNEPVRIWVIGGVIDLVDLNPAAAPTTNKEMVGGINLEYISPENSVETDGRASKLMKISNPAVPGLDANGLRFIMRTDNPGVKHKIMIAMEYFRG